MDAVNNLRKDIAIILIAHRLNTVKNCEIIFKLEKGKIVNKEILNDLFFEIKNLINIVFFYLILIVL